MKMTAKEYLQQVKKLDSQIKNKKLEKEAIWNSMKGCSAISYEPKIGTSGTINNKSPQEKYYPLLERYEKEIEVDIERLVKLKKEIIGVIDQLENGDEVNLLYMRYIQFLKWDDIAKKMNLSYQHVHKIHARALENVDNIIHKDGFI